MYLKVDLVDYTWDWIDDGLLPYALAGMRASWIWLLMHLFGQSIYPAGNSLMTPLIVFGLLAGGTACAQYGVFVDRKGWRAPALIAALGLSAVVLTLYRSFGAGYSSLWDARWLEQMLAHPEAAVPTLLVAAGAWGWGIRAGRERPGYDSYAGNFALGLVALAFGVAVTFATALIPMREALFALLFYFGLGLGMLAMASLQSTRRYEHGRRAEKLRLNRYWFGILAGVIGLVLIVGLLIGQLFAPGLIERVLGAISVILDLIVRVLLWVIYIVVYVVFKLLDPLIVYLQGLRSRQEPPDVQMPSGFAEQLQDLAQEPGGLSPQVSLILKIVVGIFLAAVIVLFFVLTFRRFRTLRQDDVEEVHESLLSADLLKEQLAGLFRRRRRAGAPPPYVDVVGADPRSRIRRIYQALLAWAAERGLSRPAGATPDEYCDLLIESASSHRDPIAAISDAYRQARYSVGPLPEALAQQAQDAWARMNQ